MPLLATVVVFAQQGSAPAIRTATSPPTGAATANGGTTESAGAPKEMFQYEVEWRLIRAGTARLSITPPVETAHGNANLKLESAGVVSKLYKVDDDYTVHFDRDICSSSVLFKAQEGKRQRQTTVNYDRAHGKVSYTERDLVKNNVALAKELEVPGCVTDVVTSIQKLRGMKLEPGQSATFPVSDGKKFVQLKIEAQERETIKTTLGTYKAIRYEAHLFNDVLYSKKGRAFIWLTDDAARMPVQIRVRLHLLIGTITFQLEKAERS